MENTSSAKNLGRPGPDSITVAEELIEIAIAYIAEKGPQWII